MSDDGTKFSKIDRFLVNDKFVDNWDSLSVVALNHTWCEDVGGGSRKDCILHNKLKKVKFMLKEKGAQKFGRLDEEIDFFKSLAHNLELKAETSCLNDSKMDLWRNARKEWAQKDKSKSNMMKPKARGIFEEKLVNHPSIENLIYPSLTIDEAECLEAPVGETEIVDAIRDCSGSKAPGPDGFNLHLFKKYWGIIRKEVIEAITWFWEKGEFSKGCNASFVTLVPKKNDPRGLGDYRPISLIGSYYKIIAKILSNRLRKVIPRLIGSEQSAFLKRRYILDGVLVANETLDYMMNNRAKGLIFKLDFEKAFDCLNWDFLLEVMKSMGFGTKWFSWILACLKSATITILINGSPTREFSIGRGVRQGDPLSPFLFILVAEGLNILTKSAIERNLFKGIEVGKDKVLVSHLQYEDDTIFFGDWSTSNAHNLIYILKYFELSSGLKVNFQKSCVYGVGVSHGEVEELALRMGCLAGKFSFTYLGLPIGAKMKKICDWDSVKEKVNTRQAIDELQIPFINSFKKCFGDSNSSSFWRDHWCGTNTFCRLFPRLFRLEVNPDATFSDRISAALDGSIQSIAWNWVRIPSGRTTDELDELQQLLQGFNFKSKGGDSWTWELATDGSFTVKKLAVLIDNHIHEAQRGTTATQPTIRNNLIPKKVEVFMWKALKKRIPVRVELEKKGIDLHSVWCPICDNDIETVDHILISCNTSSGVWYRVFSWWNQRISPSLVSFDILLGKPMSSVSEIGVNLWRGVIWTCAYLLWKNRNTKTFQNKSWNIPIAFNEVQVKSFEWVSQRIRGKNLYWLQWLSNPSVYLNLV
ncbi:uncharacterized protein [Rutidosis leptorrhynchoides]|uniref:uncharacterized protein n=1 Tax=Rutidosis leptorrhynchoides TaxID=125765 RepID=UPI003A99A4C8